MANSKFKSPVWQHFDFLVTDGVMDKTIGTLRSTTATSIEDVVLDRGLVRGRGRAQFLFTLRFTTSTSRRPTLRY